MGRYKLNIVDRTATDYMCPQCCRLYHVEQPKIVAPEDIEITTDDNSNVIDNFETALPVLRYRLLLQSPCHPDVDGWMMAISHEVAEPYAKLCKKGYIPRYLNPAVYMVTPDGDASNSKYWTMSVDGENVESFIVQLRNWNYKYPDQMLVLERRTPTYIRKKTDQIYVIEPLIKDEITGEYEISPNLTREDHQKYANIAYKRLAAFVDTLPDCYNVRPIQN